MTIGNNCDKIIKGLEEAYKLGGVTGMFDEILHYLEATVVVYNVNHSHGVDQ